MRELKFRAWDTELKHMFYPSGSMPDLIIDFNGIVYDKGYVFTSQIKKIENVILMQYIGLKDKDGIEIYEGDIVSYEWYPSERHMGTKVEIEEITFCEGCFKIGEFAFYECVNIENGKVDVKIIGNIYANPKLLKEK